LYTLELSPEWEQITEKTTRFAKDKRRTFLQGYDARLTFLQYKPYTLSLQGKRQRTTSRSSFAERTKTVSDFYSAELSLKYRTLPTRLRYIHSEDRTTGFFTSGSNSNVIQLNMSHKEFFGKTSLDASYSDSAQTISTITIDKIRKNIKVQNSLDISEIKSVALRSSINYDETNTTFQRAERYNFNEQLNWNHLPNLSTNYSFNYTLYNFYDIRNAIPSRNEFMQLGFNLNHLLYENLLTSLGLRGTSNQISGTREITYGPQLDVNYTRKTSWGSLNTNAGFHYLRTERDVTANFIQVIDESITLADGVLTLLENQNIDRTSIIITDVSGITIYTEGVHYLVTEIDNFIRITRLNVPGGIGNGDTVLVDYFYLGNPAYDSSILTQNYGLSLNLWSVWQMYYRFRSTKENFRSGIPPESLRDDTTHGAGTSFIWRWSKTSFDYEDRDTRDIPTTRWKINENISLRPNSATFVNVSGGYGRIKFRDTGTTEKSSNISSSVQRILSRRSTLTVTGFLENTSGVTSKTRDTGFTSEFIWYYNIWKASIVYTFLNERNRLSKEINRNHYLLFEINRELF
jgi:hypothetical protein